MQQLKSEIVNLYKKQIHLLLFAWDTVKAPKGQM